MQILDHLVVVTFPFSLLGLGVRAKELIPPRTLVVEYIVNLTKSKEFANLSKDGTDRGHYGLTYDPNGLLVVDAFLEEIGESFF